MKKPTRLKSKNRGRRRAARSSKSERYAVIQTSLKRGERAWFTTREEAVAEAEGLLVSTRSYVGYQPPLRLVVVRAVEIVEAKITTRRRDELAPDDFTPEPVIAQVLVDEKDLASTYLNLRSRR